MLWVVFPIGPFWIWSWFVNQWRPLLRRVKHNLHKNVGANETCPINAKEMWYVFFFFYTEFFHRSTDQTMALSCCRECSFFFFPPLKINCRSNTMWNHSSRHLCSHTCRVSFGFYAVFIFLSDLTNFTTAPRRMEKEIGSSRWQMHVFLCFSFPKI